MRHYKSESPESNTYSIFLNLFYARCVPEHQKNADLQPSLALIFVLSYLHVMKVLTCYLFRQNNGNYLKMVPVQGHHYRISNPPQVTIVQVFLSSCT